MTTRRVLIVVVVVAAMAACSSGRGVGETCREDEVCESGRCEIDYFEGFCTTACDGQDDCPAAMRCSAAPGVDGLRCAPPCDEQTFAPDFVCVGGALVACEDAGDAWNCGECGCPDDQFCDGECRPDRGVGEPCDRHDECESNNCAEAGFCQVAQGERCTDETCESCDRSPSGTSCAQTCHGNQCADHEECIGRQELDRYYCRAECDPGDVDSCAYGWRCQNIALINSTRWLCSPSPTCEVGVTSCGQGERCLPLANTGYSICSPFCSVFDPLCPVGWSCDTSSSTMACRPLPR